MEPSLDFQHIACNLCGSDDPQVLGYRDRLEYCGVKGKYKYRIVRCRSCGLLYVDPQPALTEERAEELYSKSFYSNTLESVASSPEVWEGFWNSELEDIERLRPPGTLLEVGCGVGLFLHVARSRGWQVTGVDVSPGALALARERYGVNVLQSALTRLNLPPDQFDLAYSHHVLEHTLDPAAIMTEIRRVLRPGGHVVIHVPNEASLTDRLANVYVKVKREEWTTYLRPPLHLFGFTRKTLRLMLEKAGFAVIDVKVSGFLGVYYGPHARLRPLLKLSPYGLSPYVGMIGELIGQGEFLTAYAEKG